MPHGADQNYRQPERAGFFCFPQPVRQSTEMEPLTIPQRRKFTTKSHENSCHFVGDETISCEKSVKKRLLKRLQKNIKKAENSACNAVLWVVI